MPRYFSWYRIGILVGSGTGTFLGTRIGIKLGTFLNPFWSFPSLYMPVIVRMANAFGGSSDSRGRSQPTPNDAGVDSHELG